MTDREKLIELMDEYLYPSSVGGMADHLLANGVTIQSWIPVSERMPEEHESLFAKMYGTERWMPGMFRMGSDEVLGAVRKNDGTISVESMRTLDGEWSVSRIFQSVVTHWMPLPEPPKEESK